MGPNLLTLSEPPKIVGCLRIGLDPMLHTCLIYTLIYSFAIIWRQITTFAYLMNSSYCDYSFFLLVAK